MKTLFRWAFRFFILLIILLAILFFSLDSIIRASLERQIRSRTGMDVKIGSLSVGLISPVITMENVKLYNTAEFGGSPFVDMPELHVEYDRRALWYRRLHCTLVRFNVAEVNLVQNKQGLTNLDVLKTKIPMGTGSASTGRNDFKFTGIDTLNVTAGKVTALAMRDPRAVKEVVINVHNQIIPGIKNEMDLSDQLGLIFLQKGGLGMKDFFPK